MKNFKTIFLLLICIILLTGCATETYKYSGDELFFELSGTDIDAINADGAEIIVNDEQAFVEINEDSKDYDTYSKGQHKIEKKKEFYKYYFLSLEEVKDNKFGTKDPIDLNDETYGKLELNVFGMYDYRINNINDFVSSYLKFDDDFLKINEYVETVVVDTIVEEVVKLDVKYSDLPLHVESIKTGVIKELKDKGISCSKLDIQGIKLTTESNLLVQSIDTNRMLLEQLIQNTAWVASDGSEIIFDKERFNWYLNKDDHTDNVQYGDYTFYVNELAIKYITEDLKSFGVTRAELDKMFASNEDYDKSNFVVFNINLEGYTVNGVTTTVNKPVYWYGFLLNNNQTLQVVNMTTASYYNFVKKCVDS